MDTGFGWATGRGCGLGSGVVFLGGDFVNHERTPPLSSSQNKQGACVSKVHGYQGISCQEPPPPPSSRNLVKTRGGGFPGYVISEKKPKTDPFLVDFPLQIGHFGGPKSPKFSACGGLSPLGIVVLGVQNLKIFSPAALFPPNRVLKMVPSLAKIWRSQNLSSRKQGGGSWVGGVPGMKYPDRLSLLSRAPSVAKG